MKLLIILFLLLLIALGGGVYYYLKSEKQARQISITNFEECVAAQSVVMEMYPRVCRTPDGRSFTENIGNELELMDIIHVSVPRPNIMIQSPLLIEGEARGQWFFEANFPVRLLDETGKEIAKNFATAQGEWMTENFVPFTATLEFAPQTGKKGTLLIENANPSGLPENAKKLSIPVKF